VTQVVAVDALVLSPHSHAEDHAVAPHRGDTSVHGNRGDELPMIPLTVRQYRAVHVRLTQWHCARESTWTCAWEHCVKPQRHANPRMSLTFRHIADNGGEIIGRRTFSVPTTN
jgi:hypothetical protein